MVQTCATDRASYREHNQTELHGEETTHKRRIMRREKTHPAVINRQASESVQQEERLRHEDKHSLEVRFIIE